MPGLFDAAAERRSKSNAPLADRMRPRTFDAYGGQQKLIGPGCPLRLLIERDEVPSMILWGPPGSGKTTLAKLIATATKADFIELSAVMSGVADIRLTVKDAEAREMYHQKKTILFIDEIHRFNKAQQDALLPHVERGTITLIGATTENPSFEVIAALLSRCKVFVLEKLSSESLQKILNQALTDKVYGLGSQTISVEQEVLDELVTLADGDARTALNALELAVKASERRQGSITVTLDHMRQALQRTHLVYDKGGEEHYNVISALHKSMRASDANAALYWLGRMLEAGEDPKFVARRLVRFASEDIGMADPNALPQAVAAFQASHLIGMPECNVVLAQAVVYLSEAPKSRAIDDAYSRVVQDIRSRPNEPVPLSIRNAPTALMKDVGYGQGKQVFLPETLSGRIYWKPKA